MGIVDLWDTEIYSVFQGNMKITNRLRQKKHGVMFLKFLNNLLWMELGTCYIHLRQYIRS